MNPIDKLFPDTSDFEELCAFADNLAGGEERIQRKAYTRIANAPMYHRWNEIAPEDMALQRRV